MARATPRSPRDLGIAVSSVRKWRNRFAAHRLDGLTDEPRPGQPRKITDAKVEEVIVKTLETTPKDATHWSTRSMAAEVGLNQTAVHRIWKAFGLQPHRQDAWKLSPRTRSSSRRSATSSASISTRPSARSCSASTRSPRSRRWTGPRRSCRCSRACPSAPPTTTSARAPRASTPPLDLTTGQVIGALHSATSRDRVQEVPAAHRRRSPGRVRRPPRARQQLHTQDAGDPALAGRASPLLAALHPDIDSWLNLVERWFAELTTKKLRRGAHRSVRQLNADIRAWIETWNDNPKPYVWTKTADQILESIAPYCTRINESRH